MLAGGIGTGLTFVGCTVTGMREVAPRDSGVAAGLLNTSVQVGSALGLGTLAAIASMITRNRLPGHATATALTDGYRSCPAAAHRSARCAATWAAMSASAASAGSGGSRRPSRSRTATWPAAASRSPITAW